MVMDYTAGSVVLSNGRLSDLVLNADQSRMYISRANGVISTYDFDTGQFLADIEIGKRLGGIDISADGTFVMAVQTSAITYPGTLKLSVFKVDLASSAVTSYPYTFYSVDGPFHDIALFSNGMALVTLEIRGSGATYAMAFNPADGSFTGLAGNFPEGPYAISSADHENVLVLGGWNLGLSPTARYSLGVGGEIVSTGSTSRANDAALSPDGKYIAIPNGGDISIIGSNIYSTAFTITGASGYVDFDQTSSFLYVLTSNAEGPQIQQYSVGDWILRSTISVSGLALGYDSQPSGKPFYVGEDGQFFIVHDSDTIYRIDNPTAPDPVTGGATGDTMTGTSLADVLRGMDGADTLLGGRGNDILRGGNGNDTLDGGLGRDALYGGVGDDTFIIDNTRDHAVETTILDGTDTAISTASYKLGPNIEKLVLKGTANLYGVGNNSDNILVGNSGANRLDGKAGADHMTGGAGNDTYFIDNSADTVTEQANEGTDTVRSSITCTLGGNLERLVLTGGGAINGSGNALANKLTGNAAANVLTGGGGPDQFVFETAISPLNVDRISDFSVVDDTIVLDRTIYSGISSTGALSTDAFWSGTSAHDSSDRIIYDKVTGNLFYDADGLGGAAAVKFAQLGTGLTLSNADFLVIA